MSHFFNCSYFSPSLKFFFPFFPSARATTGSSIHSDRKAARNLRPEVPMHLFMFIVMTLSMLNRILSFVTGHSPHAIGRRSLAIDVHYQLPVTNDYRQMTTDK